MNFKNILNKISLIAVIVVSSQSCLDKYPSDAILESQSMTTLSDAEQIVTGIYSGFKSGSLYGGSLTICPDIQADLVYAVDGYSNTYGSIWQWNILNTDSTVGSVYASLYTIIGRCNYFLDNLAKVRANIHTDNEIANLNYFTGEVYFARALCYSELLKLFCKAYDPATAKNELGVVIRTKYYESEPVVRKSLEDSYKAVLSDLSKAGELLEPDYDFYNNAWFSAAAVDALTARVALYMQDWDKAIEYSSKLISRETGEFELADAKVIYSGEYSYLDYMWTYDSSFEIIAKIAYTQTSYGGAQGAVFLNYERGAGRYYPDYVPAQWVLNEFDASDARYDSYFMNVTTGYPNGLTWPLMVKYYGNPELLSINVFHVNMPKIFRLAEQYLIRAEAYCHKEQFSKAKDDLFALRSKRYLSGGNLSVTKENWLEIISSERMKELYMEGFRLHDLKRWNMGFERTPQSCSLAEGSSLKIDAGDPRFVWPIPQHELEAPGSQILPNESN